MIVLAAGAAVALVGALSMMVRIAGLLEDIHATLEHTNRLLGSVEHQLAELPRLPALPALPSPVATAVKLIGRVI